MNAVIYIGFLLEGSTIPVEPDRSSLNKPGSTTLSYLHLYFILFVILYLYLNYVERINV